MAQLTLARRIREDLDRGASVNGVDVARDVARGSGPGLMSPGMSPEDPAPEAPEAPEARTGGHAEDPDRG